MTKNTDNTQPKKRDRIGFVLYGLYLLMLGGSLFIAGKLIYIQFIFEPNQRIVNALTPSSTRRITEPQRGKIYDCNGRILAMSIPNYVIHMDCTVQKARHEQMKDEKKGARLESEWLAKAELLSKSLAEVFPEKKASQYYKMITDGRQKGSRYLAIGGPVDRKTRNLIKQFPLWNEGANKGGLIIEKIDVRQYPYDKLARRTIGFIRNNKSSAGNKLVGLEGKYDSTLHGTEGIEWQRITDYGKVRDTDSTFVEAVDGKDIHTTLNIDYQEIADKALREGLKDELEVEGGCLVLMDVKTGAIRSMVNLLRDSVRVNLLEESQNIAVGRRAEPGSVFKTVTLMTVLNDGIIKSLDETIPTNHGVVQNAKVPNDHHIVQFEQRYHTNRISVLKGFEMSSNYVFATLAVANYAKDPDKFLQHIHDYNLADTFSFDIEGLRKPNIPTTKSRYWTNADLATIAYGYSTEVTPLHVLMFYNAIANKGTMMKPYLVGEPYTMKSICTPAIADTIGRALKAVTEEGTAKVLKNASCKVAGKTGTSFATFDNGKYQDALGRKKYQGTFVGYFPADDPQYTVICTIFSKPTKKSFQGGGIPARAVKTLVDQLYNIDPYWQQQ